MSEIEEIKIGTKFYKVEKIRRNKYALKQYIVDDILSTYSEKQGKLINVMYITSTVFMGQKITNYETPVNTVRKALICEKENLKNYKIVEDII